MGSPNKRSFGRVQNYSNTLMFFLDIHLYCQLVSDRANCPNSAGKILFHKNMINQAPDLIEN